MLTVPCTSKVKKFLNIFPVPNYLKMPAVGLCISDSAVRFVEIIEKPHGAVLGRYGEEKLPRGTVESGIIKNTEVIISVLKKLKDVHKFKYVRALLPEEKAYLFKTSVPVMQGVDIRESVEFKLEENVPISSLEAVFDYKIICPESCNKDTNSVSVSVSVLPLQVVSSYISVIEAAGLIPISFATESQAITRSIIREGDRRSYFVVNIDKEKTGLYIISDGVVQFTSTLSVGSNSISSVSYRGLSTNNGVEETKDVLSRSDFFPSPSLSDLKEEIKKVYMYWTTRHDILESHGDKSLPKIEKVIVCGAGANEAGVLDYISKNIPESVVLANVWTNAFSFEKYIPEIPFASSLVYAPAIGLALSDSK